MRRHWLQVRRALAAGPHSAQMHAGGNFSIPTRRYTGKEEAAPPSDSEVPAANMHECAQVHTVQDLICAVLFVINCGPSSANKTAAYNMASSSMTAFERAMTHVVDDSLRLQGIARSKDWSFQLQSTAVRSSPSCGTASATLAQRHDGIKRVAASWGSMRCCLRAYPNLSTGRVLQKTPEGQHEQLQSTLSRSLMVHSDEGASELRQLTDANSQELANARRYIEGRAPPAATKGVRIRSTAMQQALRPKHAGAPPSLHRPLCNNCRLLAGDEGLAQRRPRGARQPEQPAIRAARARPQHHPLPLPPAVRLRCQDDVELYEDVRQCASPRTDDAQLFRGPAWHPATL